MDANDHQALADWWCAALGYQRHQPSGGEPPRPEWPVPIHDPTGRGPLIWVNPVPEPKTAKNRVHLDVWGDAEELLALGARLVVPPRDGVDWHVLADPEGNEFCVFPPEQAPIGPRTVR